MFYYFISANIFEYLDPIIIVGFLLTTVTAIFSAYGDWANKSEANSKRKNIKTISILVLSVAGVIVSSLAALNAKRESEKAINLVEIKDRRIESLQRNLQDTLSVLQKNLTQTIKLGERIINRTQAMQEYAEGTGTFCYVTLGYIVEYSNYPLWNLQLHVTGKNPIENVNMRVTNLDEPSQFNNDEFYYYFNKLTPQKKPSVGEWVYNVDSTVTQYRNDVLQLNIFFDFGARHFIEEFRRIWSHGKVFEIISVTEDEKILYKRFDPNIPINILATIDIPLIFDKKK